MDLPYALLVFNSISTLIGLIYFIARFSKSVSKFTTTQHDWMTIDEEIAAEAGIYNPHAHAPPEHQNDFYAIQRTQQLHQAPPYNTDSMRIPFHGYA